MKRGSSQPSDLWARMDKVLEEVDADIVTTGFTVSDFAEHFKISRTAADQRIRNLVKLGKAVRIGKKVGAEGRLAAAYDLK